MEHHILIITSQEQLIAPISAVLKSILGHRSYLSSPEDAVKTIQTTPLDIIIMDMRQTKQCMDMLRAIKRQFPAIPVIAMVPYGDLVMVEEVMSQGADDYISQPIALERLKVTLRNMLRLRNLLQKLANKQPELIIHEIPKLEQMQGHFYNADGDLLPLRAIENSAITNAIEHYEGCITKAAKALGLGRSTLYRKMQEMTSRNHSARENHTTRPTIFEFSPKIS